MDNYDPNVEQQVWQRVFARPVEPVREDLRGLQMAAMELAAAYRNLAAVLTGKQKEHARQLYEGELANAACLKGMNHLAGRKGDAPKMRIPAKEPAARTLEKCYHRTRRAMTEYSARSMDPEFGEVFRKMADREGAHCAVLAELLGSVI